MRSHLDRTDEWPNLSELYAATARVERPVFPDGEPIGPLTPEYSRVHPLRIVFAIVLICGALLVRACMPGYAGVESASTATMRD